MNWWSALPMHIQPYIFKIGSFELRYYGLMYIVGFAVLYFMTMYRIKKENLNYTKDDVSDFLFYVILSTIIGARLGYVLFYNLPYYIENPLEIIMPFDFSGGIKFTGISGMSYHGGFIGITIASIIYCYIKKINLLDFCEIFIPSAPLGYMFGRFGNFINGELYGRVTDSPIGMLFPLDPSGQLRHPSQLYEALGEGLLLFFVLWFMKNRVKIKGAIIAMYVGGYGLIRFIIEFFREPDPQLGNVLWFLSMGQVLCVLMIMGAAGFFAIRLYITRKQNV
ncbi:MAG: prolipoprotein diacylglyceryl transferase [Spirochaetes bacterium]|nr:prolipoprotein diacylglyceryl transferase [Spirochaetota bacterium]